jgi:hypothetical protein
MKTTALITLFSGLSHSLKTLGKASKSARCVSHGVISIRNYLLFGGTPLPNPSPQREGLLPQVESPSLRGEGLGWGVPPNSR